MAINGMGMRTGIHGTPELTHEPKSGSSPVGVRPEH